MAREVSTLGQRVREAREARGMSQQALAMAAGLSMSVVTQIEQGLKQDLKFASVVRLAQALGVSLDVLAGLHEDQDAAEEKPPAPPVPSAEDLKRRGKAADQVGKDKPVAPAPPPAEDLERQSKAKGKPAGKKGKEKK
jgi:transcriptional regulator with XRE-family HTH domain